MNPRSNTLFHLTEPIDKLESILANGFWPNYRDEDFIWYNPITERIFYPMVCFCDIPLSRIDSHVKDYGSYGLGLKKSWATLNKLSPVIYISVGTHVSDALTRMLHNGSNPALEHYKESTEDINSIIAYIKPIVGNALEDGKPVQKEFYQENEWRYVPDLYGVVPPWISKEDHSVEEIRSFHNEWAKTLNPLQFSANDIEYIFVEFNKDIPRIVDFILTKLTHYTEDERKILVSRIISFESFNIDL